MIPKKVMSRIAILIALILVSAFCTLGISVFMFSIIRPELLSGDYIIDKTYRLLSLFTLVVLFSTFIVVFIRKDKRFFQ